MDSDFVNGLQVALRVFLKSQSVVTDLVGHRIVDEPNDDIAFPYVRFGDIAPRADDTDGTRGAIVSVGLKVHSQPKAGRVEAQRICGALESVLHRNPGGLVPDGFRVYEIEVLTWAVARKSDGVTYEGTVAIDVYLDA